MGLSGSKGGLVRVNATDLSEGGHKELRVDANDKICSPVPGSYPLGLEAVVYRGSAAAMDTTWGALGVEDDAWVEVKELPAQHCTIVICCTLTPMCNDVRRCAS